MWNEEQGKADTTITDDPSLRNVGITPGGIEGDLEDTEIPDEGDDMAVDDAAATDTPVPDAPTVDAAGNPL
jgi:hypothetical protein